MNKCNLNISDNSLAAFYLDSGRTRHIINDGSLFYNSIELIKPIVIKIAKENINLLAMKIGHFKVKSDRGILIDFPNVLFARELPHNLLSVKRILKRNCSVAFYHDRPDINVIDLNDNRKVIDTLASGFPVGDLYRIEFARVKVESNFNVKI